jgi:hypothetical protein
MPATVFATVTSAKQVFGGKNNIALFAEIILIRFEFG